MSNCGWLIQFDILHRILTSRVYDLVFWGKCCLVEHSVWYFKTSALAEDPAGVRGRKVSEIPGRGNLFMLFMLVVSNPYYQTYFFPQFYNSWTEWLILMRINHLSSQKTAVGRYVVVLRLHFSVYDVCMELAAGLLAFLRYAQPVSTYNLLGF